MTRQSSRSGVIVVVAVVIALVAGGVVWWRVTHGSTNQVVFVGDSITDQARPDIESRFSVDDDHLKAVPGKTIEDMTPAAKELAGLHTKKAVINLGTNNVLLGQPPDKNAQDLDQLLGAYDDKTCVVVVNINEHMLSPGGYDANGAAKSMNQQIAQWAAGRSNRKVVDWAKIVNDYDAAGKPEGPLTADTVHPTELGRRRMLDAYDEALRSCPADPF